MSDKFTAGPWTRDKYGNLIDASGNAVLFRSLSIACSGTSVSEAEANTDLIAAAPDLLAALKDLADDIAERFDLESRSTNPGMVCAVNNAREAIAKATGVQS